MATLLPQTLAAVDALIDRDLEAVHRAQELAVTRREEAEAAETVDNVLEQLVWMSDDQKARADLMIARADYRGLGKLICDVHEQLVSDRLAGLTYPRRVVLWDEVN